MLNRDKTSGLAALGALLTLLGVGVVAAIEFAFYLGGAIAVWGYLLE